MRVPAALASVALLFFAHTAEAALTSSEKGQIKDFVVEANPQNAERVRSLVVRTDLSLEESIAVLSDAVTSAPFTAERAKFLGALALDGPGASKQILVHVATRAALARADAVYQKSAGGLDREPKALAELLLAYRFIESFFAVNPSSRGIGPAALESSAKALREHVDRQSRWLKGDAAIPESVNRVRAQAQTALFDLTPDGLTRRVDVADKLALRAARKKLFVDTGMLVADAGKLDDTKIDQLRSQLLRTPALMDGVQMVVVGGDDKTQGVLARNGAVTVAPGGDKSPFGSEVAPAAHDPTTNAILLDLAVRAASRALEKRADLRDQLVADAGRVKGDVTLFLGRPRGPGAEHVLGAAMHALLVDTSRAVDSALLRMLAAKPEAAALLSDAIGALAKTEGEKVVVEAQKKLTDVKLAPNGVAVGFTLDGKKWAIDRAQPSYAVTGATVDNRIVTPSDLATRAPKP